MIKSGHFLTFSAVEKRKTAFICSFFVRLLHKNCTTPRGAHSRMTYLRTMRIVGHAYDIYIYIYFITLRRCTHQEELRNKNININKTIQDGIIQDGAEKVHERPKRPTTSDQRKICHRCNSTGRLRLGCDLLTSNAINVK